MFNGFSGICGALGVFAVVGGASYFTKSQDVNYNLDAQRKPGAFESLIAKYIRLAEFVIVLALASIVLLLGPTMFHDKTGHLPPFYASPLMMIVFSAIYGLGFIGWLIFIYEQYQQGNPHTRLQYALSEALGVSSPLCLLIGYLFLIAAVTQ